MIVYQYWNMLLLFFLSSESYICVFKDLSQSLGYVLEIGKRKVLELYKFISTMIQV